MHSAVFLDRDGTLIEDRGHLSDPSQIVFYPETVPALRMLRDAFTLFIVTHQSGLAKGLLEADQVAAVNDAVVAHLADHGITITEVYCCPHERSEDCRCIKPKPFFLRSAAADFDIDLPGSFSVGDHPHDLELAEGVGGTGIYVLTGHGRKHRRELTDGALVVPTIREAARQIRETARRRRPAP